MFGGGTSTLSMAGQSVISNNNRYVPQDSMKFLLSNSNAPIPIQTPLQRRQATGGGQSSYSNYLQSQNDGGKTEYAKMLDAQIIQKKQLEAAFQPNNNPSSLPQRLQKNSAVSKSVMQFGSNYGNAFNPNNELQRTMPQNSLSMSINQPTSNNYSLFGGMSNNISTYVPSLLVPTRPQNQQVQQQQQPDRETFFDKWTSEGDKTYTTRPQQYRGLLRKENMGEVQFSEKERKQQELSQALQEQMLYKKKKEEMEEKQRKFEDLEFLKRMNEQRNNSKDESRVQTSTKEQQRINTVVSKADRIQQRNIVSRRQENAQNAGHLGDGGSSTALMANNPNFDGSKELLRTPSKMQRKIVVQESQHFRIEKIVDVPLTSRVGTENRLDNSFLPENYVQQEKSMNRMSVNNSRIMDLEDDGRNNGKNREYQQQQQQYQQQSASQQQSYSQIQQLEQGKKNQIDMDYISDYYEFQKKVFNREMAVLKKEMNDGKFSVNKASKRENVRPPTNIIDDSRAILGIKSSKRNSQILDSEMNPYLRDLGLEKKQFQSAVQQSAVGYGQPIQQSQPSQSQLLVFHSELIPNNDLEKYTKKVKEISGEEFEDVEKNLDEMKVALEAIEELRNKRRSKSMGSLEKVSEKIAMFQELASNLLNKLAEDREKMFEQEGKGKKGESKSKKQKKGHKHKFKVDDDISERDEEEEEEEEDEDENDKKQNNYAESDDQHEEEEKSILQELASSLLGTLAHDREEYFDNLEKGKNPNLDQSHNEFIEQIPIRQRKNKVNYRSKSLGMKISAQDHIAFEKTFLKGKKIAFIVAREEKLTVEEYLWEKTSENSFHEDDEEMIQAKECLREIEKIISKQNDVFGMNGQKGQQNMLTMKEFESRRKNRIDLKGKQLADEHLQLLMREQEKETLRKQGASLEEIARVDKKYNLSNSNRHLAKLYVRAYNSNQEENVKNQKNNKINETNNNNLLSYPQNGRNGLKKSNDFDNKPLIIATSPKQSVTPKYVPILFQNKLSQKVIDHSKPLLQQTQIQSTKQQQQQQQQQLEMLDLPSRDIVYEEDNGERSNKSAASRMDDADEIAEIRQQMRLYEQENDDAALELQEEYQQILASDREHNKKQNEDEFEFEKNLNNLDKMIANFSTKQPVRSRVPSQQAY